MPTFPSDDSLCERCGYPLRGLSRVGACPECGLAIAESDPARRTGLPWQNHISLSSFLRTTAMICLQPGQSFGILRLGGSRGRDRLYLLLFAFFCSAVWAGAWVGYPGHDLALRLTLVPPAVLVLTYVEALGVAWFSRRRGWRVSWAMAERVACYASIAWLPATLLCAIVAHAADRNAIQNRWPHWLGPWSPEKDLLLMSLVGGIAILWFESLVWLGVRQVKYANTSHSEGNRDEHG
ncbi:MAG: hypothetical protein WD042_07840 [Phycisphaeraceae bacterium]